MNPRDESCGCCDGVRAATPRAVANRPGLAEIGYRIGTWADFRASMIAGLSSAARPALARLLTRDGDDFTIALVDAFACAADVLTFYQERCANENYLRTALGRESLQELARLIGYRPRPGLAAETWLAFTVEAAPAPPPGLAPEPGAFVTGVPAAIALPKGLKVQSVPGPDEKPQTFETVEPLAEARAAWNAVRPWMGEPIAPRAGDTSVYLAGLRSGLKAGDAIVVAHDDFLADPEGGNGRWELRLAAAVTPDVSRDATRVDFVRPLAAINPAGSAIQTPRVFALRRRAAAFGHNAPMWASMPEEFKSQYPGGTGDDGGFTSDWPAYTASSRQPSDGLAWIDLDAVQPEIAAGSWAVVAKGEFNRAGGGTAAVELYAVRATSEVSRAEFALSGKVSRLELSGANFATSFLAYPRELTVFAASEELALADQPVTSAVTGKLLPLAVAADGLLPGRRLIVRGSGADGETVVHFASILGVTGQGGRCTVEIDPELPAPLARDSVAVHANVALASHGETVTEILGSGNATQAFARYEIKSLPLAWRAAAVEGGAAPEIVLRVGDIAWQPLATLYGAAPAQRAYTIETDAAGRLFAAFGDGAMGARPASGTNNLRATLRKGLGAAGNVRADSLTQLAARPLGLKGVANPAAASGGTDPEPASMLRRAMPLATRTLGRAVSLLDYEDYARAFAGIAKARADLLALRGGPTVVVSIAAEGGAAIGPLNPIWSDLYDALRAAGDPLQQVQLAAARIASFEIGIRVRLDPACDGDAVLAAVEAALRSAFAFDARELVAPLQASAVIAAAHRVAGVVAADLDSLHRSDAAATEPQRRLLASPAALDAYGQLEGAELLVLAAAPLLKLEAMP